MLKLILTGALVLLAACESYTDQVSPCVGRSAKSTTGRWTTAPARSFISEVSRNAQHVDCAFRPIGADL